MRFEVSDGVMLEADAWGMPGGRSVLFAHGGGQTRHSWRSTAENFARQGWYAVSLDLRGHGSSGWSSNGDYMIPTFAADLSLVACRLGRPALIGASLGGLAGLLAEGESEQPLFSALVLVDITPWPNPEGAERIVSFMREHLEDGFATLEDAAAAVAGYLPYRTTSPNPKGLERNLRLGADGRYRWHWDPELVTGARTPSRSIHDTEVTRRLERAASRLAIPTLLVRGKLSDIVSEEAAAKLLEFVPHARSIDVSDAGHMVAGDSNDLFTSAVFAFLDLDTTQTRSPDESGAHRRSYDMPDEAAHGTEPARSTAAVLDTVCPKCGETVNLLNLTGNIGEPGLYHCLTCGEQFGVG